MTNTLTVTVSDRREAAEIIHNWSLLNSNAPFKMTSSCFLKIITPDSCLGLVEKVAHPPHPRAKSEPKSVDETWTSRAQEACCCQESGWLGTSVTPAGTAVPLAELEIGEHQLACRLDSFPPMEDLNKLCRMPLVFRLWSCMTTCVNFILNENLERKIQHRLLHFPSWGL